MLSSQGVGSVLKNEGEIFYILIEYSAQSINFFLLPALPIYKDKGKLVMCSLKGGGAGLCCTYLQYSVE